MRRSESVVDIDVAKGGQSLAELRIVFLLLRMETKVFQQDALAFLAGGDRSLGAGSDDILSKSHLAVQQLIQPVGHRL